MIILALLATAATYDAVPARSLDGVLTGCAHREIPDKICRCMIGKMSTTSERRMILDAMGTGEVTPDAASMEAVARRHPGASPKAAEAKAGPLAMQVTKECAASAR